VNSNEKSGKSYPHSISAEPKPGLKRRRDSQHPRNKMSVSVTVCSGENVIKGNIVDLSFGGAFMVLPKLPNLNCSVKLLMEIPKTYAIVVSAEIVRFDSRLSEDDSSQLYGVDVRFVNVSDEFCLTVLDALCHVENLIKPSENFLFRSENLRDQLRSNVGTGMKL